MHTAQQMKMAALNPFCALLHPRATLWPLEGIETRSLDHRVTLHQRTRSHHHTTWQTEYHAAAFVYCVYTQEANPYSAVAVTKSLR